MKPSRWIGALAVVAAAPAAAQSLELDLPADRLGEQVHALGRLSRVNVAVSDPRLWARPVPRLRGRMSAATALAAIARAADARIERLGPDAWRLTPRPVPPRRLSRPRAPMPGAPPPGVMGPDIVVTASKRDLTRDRFAGQVSRVDGADLTFGGPAGTEKLTQRLASVASTHLGAGRNKLFIRGIADSSFTGPTQATVGQYLGDLRLSYNAPDPDLRLVDLAAVEVLEGPQGTLYGAGSLGGLIRLVPNAPDPGRIGASAAIGGSTTRAGAPGVDVEAMLNLPVVADRLAIRIAGTAASEGGYIDKPLLGRTDVNRTRVGGGRATVHLALGGGWSAELIGIGQRIRGEDSQYADRGNPPLTRSAPVIEGFAADFGQAQLVVAGQVGAVSVRSTSGITAHDLIERYDATVPGEPVRLFAQANRTRMRANETRAWDTAADGSGWLAGLSYVRNRTRLTRLLGTPGALLPSTGVDNGVEETTLYGEGSVRLLHGLLATAGLRATRSVLDGAGEDVEEPPLAPFAALIVARRTQTIVLPSASALVGLAPGSSLFVRYQQGFRPGGLAIESGFVRQFRNDRVATIEAGYRLGRPNRGPFDLSLLFARTAWRNIQADFIDGSGLPSTANIGDGRIWTAEATIGVVPLAGWRLEVAAAYNDGRVDEPSRALVAALVADQGNVAAARAELFARLRQIPNIARITTRVGAIYQRSLGDERDLRVDGWLRYVGPSRLGVGPVLGQLQGSYVDSGLTARIGFGSIGLTGGVTNLLDVRGNRFALGTPFATGREQVTPLRPRTLRIGVDRRF